MSQVSGDTTKIEFGPCQVTFGGTDLGYFQGGVTFNYEITWLDIEVDQHSSPVDSQVQRENVSVTIPMTETDIDTLENLLPTGSKTTDGNKRKMEFGGTQVDISSDAKELVITPCIDGSGTLDTDANNKVTIHKALPKLNFSKGYNVDGIRVVEVEFIGLADTDHAAGNELFLLGDSSAV